jgi:hypothetical protein
MLRTGDNIKQNIRFRETCCVGEGWNSLIPSKLVQVLTFLPFFRRMWVRKLAGTLVVLVFACFLQSLCLYEQILGSNADTTDSTQIHQFIISQNHYDTRALNLLVVLTKK